jgi:RNA polymerase sigma-70 factor (ECF subfamily)
MSRPEESTATRGEAPARLEPDLVAELEPTLFRYARRRVATDELAHDLVQETWLAALGGIDRFAGRSSLRTWLVSILRRKIVDSHRRKRPKVTFEEHHSPPVDPPRERFDDAAALKMVHEELPSLPRRERQAVTFVDVEGLSREEAASRMGVKRTALRVMLHRGRKRLSEKLSAAGHAFS